MFCLFTVSCSKVIYTTNYDLLVEQAYDKIRNSADFIYEIKPIRKQKELNYFTGNNELK